MNYQKQKEVAEVKRKELIGILESAGCTTFDAVQFAIEEYFLGNKNTKYSYQEYHEHFVTRSLNRKIGNDLRPRFGHQMTEVLDRLFYEHLSNIYMVIKTAVYKRMDELKESDDLWVSGEYCANFEEWVNAYSDEFIYDEDIDNEDTERTEYHVVDYDWNLLVEPSEDNDEDEKEVTNRQPFPVKVTVVGLFNETMEIVACNSEFGDDQECEDYPYRTRVLHNYLVHNHIDTPQEIEDYVVEDVDFIDKKEIWYIGW